VRPRQAPRDHNGEEETPAPEQSDTTQALNNLMQMKADLEWEVNKAIREFLERSKGNSLVDLGLAMLTISSALQNVIASTIVAVAKHKKLTGYEETSKLSSRS